MSNHEIGTLTAYLICKLRNLKPTECAFSRDELIEICFLDNTHITERRWWHLRRKYEIHLYCLGITLK